jgi:hypothetical protein
MELLMPAGEILSDVLQLDLESNNAGTGAAPVTDWKAQYRVEASHHPFYDIVYHKKGVDQGQKVEATVRYRFVPAKMKYLPVSPGVPIEASSLRPATEKGANFYSGTGDLVPTLHLPATLQAFKTLFGPPQRILYPPAEDDSPMGQLYCWHFDGATLKVMADDYDRTRPNYRAGTLGMWLVSDGTKAVPSLCGAELGKDDIAEVYRKIQGCFRANPGGGGNYPLSIGQYPWQEEPLVLKFKDPRTGLMDLFYFREGILWKIWQGKVDPTMAD